MRYLINLFPVKERNTVDQIIYFAFHYLRYILVITQFVVICVFFYRFKVDQDIVDLKDELKQKENIVKATKPLLTEIGQINKKITDVKTVLAKQSNLDQLYVYFFNNLPSSITLTNFIMQDNSVEVNGVSQDAEAVQQFYEKMKSEGRFKTTELKSVNKTENGYEFALSLQKFSQVSP